MIKFVIKKGCRYITHDALGEDFKGNAINDLIFEGKIYWHDNVIHEPSQLLWLLKDYGEEEDEVYITVENGISQITGDIIKTPIETIICLLKVLTPYDEYIRERNLNFILNINNAEDCN